MEKVLVALRAGKPARTVTPTEDEQRLYQELMLITAKPVLYVCNVEEASAAEGNAFSARVKAKADAEGAAMVVISVAIEAEVAQLDSDAEKQAFLADQYGSASCRERVCKYV